MHQSSSPRSPVLDWFISFIPGFEEIPMSDQKYPDSVPLDPRYSLSNGTILYRPTMAQSTIPLDHIAIQNVLTRYCEALDMKELGMLEKVFVKNVVASYPFNRELKGVENVANAIQNRLGPIRTHHNLTTQSIRFSESNKNSAYATTHFIGVHFGQGPHDGKTLTAYGTYVDELECFPASNGDYEGVPGASGVWRITKRTVLFIKRIGDEQLMKEH